MSSLTNSRNGGMLITPNERSMPKWVTEQSDRIGPRPPPPPLTPENGHASVKQPALPPKIKTQPEPDYEVIEFSNQQYSNAPLRPNSASSGSKTPDNKLKCTLCGSANPWVTCEECGQQIFCASCDDMFHKHPKRKGHQRKTLEKSKPPLPPKILPGEPGPTPPVAPPRRNKRGLMTPLMQRKDQGNAMPGPFPVPTSPTPSSKNGSWKERFGSLPRGLNLLNRPLPETPKTPSESSRSTTPKSVFDNIQRPPSVALEKIKNKANATLDRMQLLQQRYRQQREQMERERGGSVTDQRHLALQHHQMAVQRANQLGQRGMSNSVFNLNQINRKQLLPNNGWMNNSMQQAQSMAQLNCVNCVQQSQWNGHSHVHMPQDPWSNQLSSQQHLNRSNMSLNVSAGYMMQPQMNNMYPPPTFMNQRGLMQQMYPQPYMGGMPVMNPGLMGIPPATSRAASRAGSRMASPAMSRKSATLRRKQRSNYIDDEATDDEESDEDDRRSVTSTRSGVSRSRQRRMSSASQIQLDDDFESSQAKSRHNRTRHRRDSVAKSVHNDWAPGRRSSTSNNNRSADSGFNSPLKPSRIYSDLDSEGSGTRALVQAKIEQKLKEDSLKQKQTKPKRQSQSPTAQKTSSSVQTATVRHTIKQEPETQTARQTTKSESEEEFKIDKKSSNEEVQKKPETASEEEESESEESKESESEHEPEPEAEAEPEHIDENKIEEDDLGPPPSTPDHEWECEFCTFVNEPNIKICTICCKTPSIKPKKVAKSISPPEQLKTPVAKKDKEHVNEKPKDRELPKDKSGTIKKKPLTSSQSSSLSNTITNNIESEKIINNIQTTKTDSAHNTDNEGNESTTTDTLKNKESVDDIWATLDENIQATAHEVTRKAESKKTSKVSTACGTSSKSASVERQGNDSRQSQAEENGTSPTPQSISTQTYDTLPVQKSKNRDEANAKHTQPNQALYNDMIQESDLYKHTTEELNAALKYCGPDMHPLVWLRDNWPKLIQTVQSLATKYGQERAENTIGTISQMEARDALRMHTGNIWQAVSECIEQRQRKYREISSKGNFSREDIVTALTTHQGNMELALNDLGRTQLKPFLMRIWGSPGGVENESGSQPLPAPPHSSQSEHFNMGKDIHNFLSANASDCMQIPNTTGAFPNNNQMPSPFDRPASLNSPYENNNNHMLDNTSSYSADSKDFTNSPLPLDEAILTNKNVLKDLETLIGNMEHNQQNQNEQVIRSMHDMITNINTKTGNEYDSETMRILTKSPITSPKLKTIPKDHNSESEADVKNFVWQHIQEIVPNLVQQVEMELMEDIEGNLKTKKQIEEITEIPDEALEVEALPLPPPPPPIDQDEFLMEEVIKPNIKNASMREVLPPQYFYSAEITTFQLAFDKALQREHEEEFEFDILTEAINKIYKMYKAPEIQTPKNQSLQPEQTEPITERSVIGKPEEIGAAKLPTHTQTPSAPSNTDISSSLENTIRENKQITEDVNGEEILSKTDIEHTSNTDVIPNNFEEPVPTEAIPSDIKADIPTPNKNDKVSNSIEREETVVQIVNTVIHNDELPSTSKTASVNKTALTESSLKEPNDILEENCNQSTSYIPPLNNIKSQIPETVATTHNDHTKQEKYAWKKIYMEPKEKQETRSVSSQKTRNKKDVKARTKNLNQYKRTTLKDLSKVLEQAEAEPTIKNNYTQDMNNIAQSNESTNENNSTIQNVSGTYETQQLPELVTEHLPGKTIKQEVTSLEEHIQSVEIRENETVNTHSVSSDESAENSANIPNKENLVNETKVSKNEISNSSGNKRVSKIPVRRTASNKSLIISSAALTKSDSNTDMIPQSNLSVESSIIKIPETTTTNIQSPKNVPSDEESEEELYSIQSETSATEVASSRANQFQSPTTTSEMFLVIQQEGTENNSTIAPSTSSSTLHSIFSQSSGLKSPTEFIPSGDPSKQNLTELVEDTQRLIKQMKDEISIDDFESSTDEGEYTDDYSDEYDEEEGEEEEEVDEEWEEEDDEEYGDITDDITEENEDFTDDEEDSISKTQSPHPSQEYQDHRESHNNSVLSNITESSDHSQALQSGHFEQDETEITQTSHTQIVVIDSENNLPELPVETIIAASIEKSSQPITQFVESENSNPEMSPESVLSQVNVLPQDVTQENFVTLQDFEEPQISNQSVETENNIPEVPIETALIQTSTLQQSSDTIQEFDDKTSIVKDLRDILSTVIISKTNELETETSKPELPVEAVIDNIQTDEKNQSANVEENLATQELVSVENEDDLSSTSLSEDANFENKTKTEMILHKSESHSIQSQNNSSSTSEATSSNHDENVPTTSKSAIKSNETENESPANSKPAIITSQNDLPSTSKTTPSNRDDNVLPTSNSSIKSNETKKRVNEEIKTSVKKSLAASKIPKPKEIRKEQKSKEVQHEKPQNEFKKKLYTRSKSFSGPPTPIGISSVKSISQKFIAPPQNTSHSSTPKNHPIVARRSSIVEAINKLTKPNINTEKPTVSTLFKSRTQPRIPKKKYHETCFSDDDYESSSPEEEFETLEVRQRKLSIPVFRAYPSVQEPEEINTEELVERFMKEELATTIVEAQIAATLISMKFQQDVSLWAAKECSDLDHAVALLKQECELCSGTYALNQIVSMLKCTHKCCKQCAKTYFTVTITERSINDCSCPFCKLPELHNQTEHEDENLEYFSNLDIFLKNILEPDVHELFQRKLRDRTLLKDPNFKWCMQCSSGFFARPKQKRLICPDCGSVTCAQCRKTWQKQHEGISCDKYSEWESANDPEIQAKGVQQHLEQNGIDCPKCKFRYSLARGGCMHFTCTQCRYEFCYGCAKPFMMGAKCNISPYCAKLGLHAHHPRNCLFYLRDKLPIQLQLLLKNNRVSFEVDPLESVDTVDDNTPSSSKKKELLCVIPIQKETPTGLVDTKCSGEVPDKHAGMCRTHYVEYLTAMVAKSKIDPLPIFDLTDCVQELRRRGIALPERGPWDTDEIYKTMCSEVIQKNIPLDVD